MREYYATIETIFLFLPDLSALVGVHSQPEVLSEVGVDNVRDAHLTHPLVGVTTSTHCHRLNTRKSAKVNVVDILFGTQSPAGVAGERSVVLLQSVQLLIVGVQHRSVEQRDGVVTGY